MTNDTALTGFGKNKVLLPRYRLNDMVVAVEKTITPSLATYRRNSKLFSRLGLMPGFVRINGLSITGYRQDDTGCFFASTDTNKGIRNLDFLEPRQLEVLDELGVGMDDLVLWVDVLQGKWATQDQVSRVVWTETGWDPRCADLKAKITELKEREPTDENIRALLGLPPLTLSETDTTPPSLPLDS